MPELPTGPNEPMFTLVLTNNAHTISGSAARVIKDAIARGDATVDTEIDLWGPPASKRATTIVLAHVVAVTEIIPVTLQQVALDATGTLRRGQVLNRDTLTEGSLRAISRPKSHLRLL